MARYGIPTDNAVGIPVGKLRAEAKRLGKNHELAAALWKSGSYEARMLATFVDDPAQVTAAQMDSWCKDALRELTSSAVAKRLAARATNRSPARRARTT
jgi:3-methyladenine DNA glycosylase AlkD